MFEYKLIGQNDPCFVDRKQVRWLRMRRRLYNCEHTWIRPISLSIAWNALCFNLQLIMCILSNVSNRIAYFLKGLHLCLLTRVLTQCAHVLPRAPTAFSDTSRDSISGFDMQKPCIYECFELKLLGHLCFNFWVIEHTNMWASLSVQNTCAGHQERCACLLLKSTDFAPLRFCNNWLDTRTCNWKVLARHFKISATCTSKFWRFGASSRSNSWRTFHIDVCIFHAVHAAQAVHRADLPYQRGDGIDDD